MFSMYELYDLHMILIAIRSNPTASINKDIVLSTINVLNNATQCDEINQLRKVLQSVKTISEYSIYDFVFTENKYTYYPLPFLKNEKIYTTLLIAFKELYAVLNENNSEKIVDLADCLHNLPIMIVENSYSIPRSFWNKNIRSYCKKWSVSRGRF